MMTNLKGRLFEIIKENCPADFDAMYQANTGQVTVYINDPISTNDLRVLQTRVMKYIGDNLMGDSYKTVKYFY